MQSFGCLPMKILAMFLVLKMIDAFETILRTATSWEVGEFVINNDVVSLQS